MNARHVFCILSKSDTWKRDREMLTPIWKRVGYFRSMCDPESFQASAPGRSSRRLKCTQNLQKWMSRCAVSQYSISLAGNCDYVGLSRCSVPNAPVRVSFIFPSPLLMQRARKTHRMAMIATRNRLAARTPTRLYGCTSSKELLSPGRGEASFAVVCGDHSHVHLRDSSCRRCIASRRDDKTYPSGAW
jgi:hypothetical protein